MVIHDINKVKSFLLKQLSVKGFVSESEALYELTDSHPHPHPKPESQPYTHPQS